MEHRNAPLTRTGRLRLVRLVEEDGLTKSTAWEWVSTMFEQLRKAIEFAYSPAASRPLTARAAFANVTPSKAQMIARLSETS